MSGEAELEAMIRKIKSIPDLVRAEAPACAKAFGEALSGELAAGHGPNGQAWPARKKDGGRALPNAAGAVTTSSSGTVVIARIGPPYVFHDKGTGGGLPQRKILPDGMFPSGEAAIRSTLVDAFNRKVRR